jgi:hypothetical protein
MITKYIKTDNKCYGSTSGSIRITYIEFTTEEEIANFAQYIVEWSNNVPTANIKNSGRNIINLPNGTYSYRLKSLINDTYGSITNVTISSPEVLELTEIKKSEYSCGNNGYYECQITGGLPPYNIFLNNNSIINESTYSIDTLPPGTYKIKIIDSNNCTIEGDTFIIKDDNINLQYNRIYPPILYDGNGSLDLTISGFGPFDLKFVNNTTNEIYIYSKFNNAFLVDIQNENLSSSYYTQLSGGPLGPSITDTDYTVSSSIYQDSLKDRQSYRCLFDKTFSPGDYTLYVNPSATNNRCSLESLFTIPNISPITVSINIKEDTNTINKNLVLTRDIYDTLLIPYKHIQNDSNLWQTIKNLSINSSIYFNINGVQNEFIVVRNMLDKYSINNIEILKLGNNSNEWFYYLHVAPGIQDFASTVSLINLKTKESFDITLGLKDNDIDSDNASLIKGSLIINGTGYKEFFNGGCAGISVGSSPSGSDIILEEISTSVLKNIYSPLSYDTTINFLQKFNVLTYNLDLNNTLCDIYPNSFNYLQYIKQLIKIINNSNNYNNIYIYSIGEKQHNGSVNLNINGQYNFITPEENLNNIYTIQYYTFNQSDSELKNILFANEIIKDTEFINNLDERYILIRIKDRFNNIAKYINWNNNIINYDMHFLNMKQILEQYNYLILNQIQYGDILVYIGSQDNTTIPSSIIDNSLLTDNFNYVVSNYSSQNQNINNTSITEPQTLSISVKISPQNIKCIIYGPKNYYNTFDKDTTFSGLLPGVYIIKGEEEDLKNNLLYQNEIRIILNSSNQLVNLIFAEYSNKITYS